MPRADRGKRRGQPARAPPQALLHSRRRGVGPRVRAPRRRDLPRRPPRDGAQAGRRDLLVARREACGVLSSDRNAHRRRLRRGRGRRPPPEPQPRRRAVQLGSGLVTGREPYRLRGNRIRTSSGSSPCGPTGRIGGPYREVDRRPERSARRASLVSRRRLHRVHARREPLRRPARRVGAAIGPGGRRRFRLVAGRTPASSSRATATSRSPIPTGAVRRSSRGRLTCTRAEPNSRPTGTGWSISPSTRPIRRSRTGPGDHMYLADALGRNKRELRGPAGCRRPGARPGDPLPRSRAAPGRARCSGPRATMSCVGTARGRADLRPRRERRHPRTRRRRHPRRRRPVRESRGKDRLFGGPGRDFIDAYDGRRDLVDGGAGRDRGLSDRHDRLRSVERYG